MWHLEDTKIEGLTPTWHDLSHKDRILFLKSWGRLLRVPWAAKRYNQSILKEINPDYLLEGMRLKQKLQYCGPLMPIANSLENTLKTEGRRRRGNRGRDGWMASPTRWTWLWASSQSWWWTEKPGMLQSMGSQRVGHDWVTEQQQIKIVSINVSGALLKRLCERSHLLVLKWTNAFPLSCKQ